MISYAVITNHSKDKSIQPPPSIHSAIGKLSPQFTASKLAATADVYLQNLIMMLHDRWQFCVSALRRIATVRSAKRLDIIRAFTAFAEKGQLPLAAKSHLASNLVQVC